MSLLSHNAGMSLSKEEIAASQEQIHRLQEDYPTEAATKTHKIDKL
jgi:hypothetical protein